LKNEDLWKSLRSAIYLSAFTKKIRLRWTLINQKGSLPINLESPLNNAFSIYEKFKKNY
jgi:hypothetical protein